MSEAGTGDIQSSVSSSDIGITSPSPMSRTHEIAAAPQTTLNDVKSQRSPSPSIQAIEKSKPLPPNVLAAYRTVMRHEAPLGVPCASLQLRSYSVRNLEFFADFCMRAAYYLNLPARGPNPLPRRRERWTTIRSNFIFKKSQENFERITHRRLVTILDGEKSVVETWLAFIRKWQFYGVGMKAHVWSWESLEVGKNMDKAYTDEIETQLSEKMKLFGFNEASRKSLEKMMERQGPRQVGVPMTNLRRSSTTTAEMKQTEVD